MQPELKVLQEISHSYGKNREYTIAGGGNTSYKSEAFLWIKASGTDLECADEKSFIALNREKIRLIFSTQYNRDPLEREIQLQSDLIAAVDGNLPGHIPVETLIHEVIRYPFIVQTHPYRVNGLLCARQSREAVIRLFRDTVLYIEYADPGYLLAVKVKERIDEFQTASGDNPRIVFIENYGVFIGGNTAKDIRDSYENIEKILNKACVRILPEGDLLLPEKIVGILPAVRMMFTDSRPKVIRIRHNKLIADCYGSPEAFEQIRFPFTPAILNNVRSEFLYVEETGSPESIIESIRKKLADFSDRNGFLPVILLIKGLGLVAVGDSWESAGAVLDAFECHVRIGFYTGNFGGPRFLSKEDMRTIESRITETPEEKLPALRGAGKQVDQKIILITGAAQGFGEGIARDLMDHNANIVIADINEEKGQALANELNGKGRKNRALFVRTDVSDAVSVQHLMSATVAEFGGLDVLVSNAGILHAGDLNEMDPDTFERMTKINYNGYFLCVKYASEILKVQSRFHDSCFTDIIQINSKSGLQGSNRNFTYAGSKFGGIGLTQSFALELIPYRIKVNAICPGNFFEGPLWSDPVNGLFVQYLKTGKVPGAKNIEDVKKYYEAQVPAGRGCTVEDVMKALYYAIDQQYETGQAIPVTGGQIMLK